MMNLFLLNFLILLASFAKPTIETDKARWRPYFVDATPLTAAVKWYLPFESADRKDIRQLKVISIFGDHRNSYLSGHIHTAIDINPAQPKDKFIGVYALSKGVVCSVHLGENQKTLVVKHKLPDGTILFVPINI